MNEGESKKKNIFEAKSWFLSFLSCVITVLITSGIVMYINHHPRKPTVEPNNYTNTDPVYGDRTFYKMDFSNKSDIILTPLEESNIPTFPLTITNDVSYTEEEWVDLSRNILGQFVDSSADLWNIRNLKYHLYNCN